MNNYWLAPTAEYSFLADFFLAITLVSVLVCFFLLVAANKKALLGVIAGAVILVVSASIGLSMKSNEKRAQADAQSSSLMEWADATYGVEISTENALHLIRGAEVTVSYDTENVVVSLGRFAEVDNAWVLVNPTNKQPLEQLSLR